MNVEQVLEKYGLTRDTATQYIDAITRGNQTETAEELDVSRQTINHYKKQFQEMSPDERLLLITSLAQDQLLESVTE